jgi:hypothetical protein
MASSSTHRPRPASASATAVTILALAVTFALAGAGVPPAGATGPTCSDEGQGALLYGGGTGEADDPYRIATLAHLEALRDRVNLDAENQTGCAFLQTADLDLSGIASWTPIGMDAGSSSRRFRGGYDGGFHRISNLTITDASLAPNVNSYGLFGRVDRSSSAAAGSVYLRNLRLVDVDIALTSTAADDLYVGGLAGRVLDDAAVAQVAVTGSITVDYRSDEDLYVGGLVGRTRGSSSVSDRVVFIGTIDVAFGTTGATKQANVGGLVGRTSDGSTVSLGYASADVVVTAVSVGGTPNVGDLYAGVLVGTSSTQPSTFAEMYAVGSVEIEIPVGVADGYAGVFGFIGNADDSFTDLYYLDSIGSFAGGQVLGFGAAGLVNVNARTDAEMRLAQPAATMTGTGGRWTYANVPGASNPDGTWYLVLAPRPGEYPYPVFFWEIGDLEDIEDAVVASSVAAGPSVMCTPLDPRVDATVTCQVLGGDAGIDVLWRVAVAGEPVGAAGLRLGPDGSGTFSFVVPRAALGLPLTVELVEWSGPVPIGTAGGPLPARVPAGQGPSVPFGPLVAAALVGFAAVAAGLRRLTLGTAG